MAAQLMDKAVREHKVLFGAAQAENRTRGTIDGVAGSKDWSG